NKRKALEDNGEEGRKSKKERIWLTDGEPPCPTPKAVALVSKLSSVSSGVGLRNLVKLVQSLVARNMDLDVVDANDYSFEGTLKLCAADAKDRAFRDLHSMILYIRL